MVSWGWEVANQHSLGSAFLLFGGTGTLRPFTSGTFLVFGELQASGITRGELRMLQAET